MKYNEWLETEQGTLFLNSLTDDIYTNFLKLFKGRYGEAVINFNNHEPLTAWVEMHKPIFLLLDYQAEQITTTLPNINALTTIMENDKVSDKAFKGVEDTLYNKDSTAKVDTTENIKNEQNSAGAANMFNIANSDSVNNMTNEVKDNSTNNTTRDNTELINDKQTTHTDIIDVTKLYEFRIKQNNLYTKIINKFLRTFFITVWYN